MKIIIKEVYSKINITTLRRKGIIQFEMCEEDNEKVIQNNCEYELKLKGENNDIK